MFKKILWVMAVSVLVWNVLGIDALAASKEDARKPVKDLYYFVIDRSGSIAPKCSIGSVFQVVTPNGAHSSKGTVCG